MTSEQVGPIAPLGLFTPKIVVPKVRVELTRNHPHRFLSLVQVVLISVIRRGLVNHTESFPENVCA